MVGLSRRTFCLVGAVTLAAGLVACSGQSPSSPSPSTPLTPARSLAGTWTTSAAVPFIAVTDFCGRGRHEFGRSLWNVTWAVSAAPGYTNVVDVEMRTSRGSMTPMPASCGGSSGWVPPVSPMFFQLCITSSELTWCNGKDYPNGYAYGPFTANTMGLTWTHYECLVYCSGEYTETNQLKMTKTS